MRKVLLIGFLARPRQGSYRLEGLARYLPEFGWQPVVLTAPPEEKPYQGLEVIEVPYRDALGFWRRLFRLREDEGVRRGLKKRLGISAVNSPLDSILNFCQEIYAYPDLERGWRGVALKAGEGLLRKTPVDAMISNSPPVTCQLVARELKARYGLPWVADLPDLWSQNHYYLCSPLRRMLDRNLEVKTLFNADALITVSQPWADKLRKLHKGREVFAIPRGFHWEEVNTRPAGLTPKLTITYTGNIYPGTQDPAKLFAALRDLLSQGAVNPQDIQVRFYGHQDSWLGKEVERYGISGVVKQYEWLSREAALEKQRESQVLLLLNWEDPLERGVYPGKVFEYLAARRPILATGGPGGDVIQGLLEETGAGIYASTGEDIKKALLAYYQEYKERGRICYRGDEGRVNKYSYRQMAGRFAEVLDTLVGK